MIQHFYGLATHDSFNLPVATLYFFNFREILKYGLSPD